MEDLGIRSLAHQGTGAPAGRDAGRAGGTGLPRAARHFFVQPIRSIRAPREVAWWEVLTRPARLSAEQFFLRAEARGRVHRVDLAIWRTLAAFRTGVPLSINVSARSLDDSRSAARLLSVLLRGELLASGSMIELTETWTIENPRTVLSFARAVKEAGLCFGLDDLQSTPDPALAAMADVVKVRLADLLDLQRWGVDSYADVIKCLRAHGCFVVIENIETDEQLDLAVEIGVDYVQGYYVGWPLSLEVLRDAIA